MVAWPEGTKTLRISSSLFKEASITAPTQPCELQALRACEKW